MNRKRYAQVGLGGRHSMFRDCILGKYSERAEYVGVCDSNPGRLALAQRTLMSEHNLDVAGYPAERFDEMIADTRPDAVIVTTKDSEHHTYICRAMELGCDVITEKPMTIDEEQCRMILDTQKRTGKRCTVTFNYRYAPPRTQLKDMLMSGVIGDIISVDFHWMLNLVHGADYFRRWHRNKVNSGGLMVHKSTHHFDLVNWWLSTVPERVFASGNRRFYTPRTADRYGLVNRAERCHACPEAKRCRFFLDLTETDTMKSLYLDCEEYDGYFRDRCVFSPDIDIEDSMNVVVDYRSGAKMTYSLNAFMPWEGYVVTFNGSAGRIEHKCEETVYVNGDETIPGMLRKEGTWTRVYPNWEPAYEVDVWSGEGGHGGADPVMLDYVFAPEEQMEDPYKRAADQRSGAWSILTGIAANHSMRENRPIQIDELVPNLAFPDYPPMPSADEPLAATPPSADRCP